MLLIDYRAVCVEACGYDSSFVIFMCASLPRPSVTVLSYTSEMISLARVMPHIISIAATVAVRKTDSFIRRTK